MARSKKQKRQSKRDKSRVRGKRINHFRTRAKQRYGMDLSRADVIRISNMIPRDPDVEELERLSNTKTRYRVRYRGQVIDVIYSRTSYSVITAVPYGKEGE